MFRYKHELVKDKTIENMQNKLCNWYLIKILVNIKICNKHNIKELLT